MSLLSADAGIEPCLERLICLVRRTALRLRPLSRVTRRRRHSFVASTRVSLQEIKQIMVIWYKNRVGNLKY